ncbi:MAG: carboxylating nicotinate-nucleotide diphosphorylase [Legionellales bacterium]|jgi:nicotinate-nucleotide pyrophosphorylase (carboxylating)
MTAQNHLEITTLVAHALKEDIGRGDLSAQLIAPQAQARAQILSREAAVLCGVDFAKEVFNKVDPSIKQDWQLKDGDKLLPDQIFCTLAGPAHSILTAERTALNFLQTLSATATRTAYFVDLIKDTKATILDTRKTIPGLRDAQKYAVRMGGGTNHRHGLFDAILIKENHIKACGSITNAIQTAKEKFSDIKIMIEVENLHELQEAIRAHALHIMLDNFSLENIIKAVNMKPANVKLEASGGINEGNILAIAQAGVDYISLGTLTKDINAVDLSLLFNQT